MNNNVRLVAEIVIALVAVVAIGLYFPQRGELADAQATVTALSADNEAQAASISDLEAQAATASDMEATAMADVEAANAQIADAQAEATEQADMAAEAQAAADAAAEAQAAAEADAQAQADMVGTAIVDIEAAQADAQAQADMAATAMADAEAAQAEVANLQATIDAMNAATPEPEVEEPTEEAVVEETEEPTEEAPMVEVVGFSNDVFSMALDASYTTFNLTGDDREASLTTITAADADLGARVTTETAHDYAAWQGVGEYVLVNQQAVPAGVDGAAELAGVGLRRADNAEVVTLGENEVARGTFGADEVRYILIDGGSMWVITFHSADVAGNMDAFDAAVASFNAPEPPAEEESGE